MLSFGVCLVRSRHFGGHGPCSLGHSSWASREWGAGYRCTSEVTRGICGVAALCVEVVLAGHHKDSAASGP